MLLDLRPISYPMLVICNHEVAEQLTKASARYSSSTPKSPTLRDIWHLTGNNSILTDEVCRPKGPLIITSQQRADHPHRASTGKYSAGG